MRECGKRRPPLYDEMAYVLGRMGDTRRALTILLEVGFIGIRRRFNIYIYISLVHSREGDEWVGEEAGE